MSSTTRSSTRRAWRIVGVVATVLVIGVGIAGGSVLAAMHQQNLDTTTDQTAATFEQAPTTVSVDGETADVTLTAADSDEVAVERTVEWARTEPVIDETWNRGDLTIDLGCPGEITSWFNDVCRIDYGAQLPRRTPLDVGVTTGDITVEGALGDTDVSTTTGSIDGTGLTAPTVSTRATTGSIRLEHVTTPDTISASVTTGDISISVPDDGTAYRVIGETETGGRDVQVATDPSSEHVIDVTSTTGDVEIGYRR